MREQEQQAQLARMRAIATGLFVLMAIIFGVTSLARPTGGWLVFVHAFAEAAMVGALADWFAVTALFRRPLGLPIPHTAIIPANKDRIGAGVANFLEHNFMTREVLAEELKPIDFAGAAAHWLAEPANSRAVALQAVSAVPALFRMLEDQDAGPFMQAALSKAMRNMKFAPLLAEILAVLIADRRHQILFDHLIGMAADALEQNRPFIRQKVHDKSPRWIPRAIDEKIFERILEESQDILEEMRQEDSEWRERFQDRAEEFIERLRTSPDYEEKIGRIVNQTLEHPLFRDYTRQVWQDIKSRVLADASSADSHAVARLERLLGSLAETMLHDLVIQDKLNQWIRAFAAEAISGRRHVIADLVQRVIRKWDADTVSHKFELYVGKDLQYIRINGTLVGGLVGLVLHALSLAF
jgi:uncharacterized membrane-anchored protein YjiN (DUF445 family)